MFTSIDEWESFFAEYRRQAASLFEREGWELADPRWQESVASTLNGITDTETRLGVELPTDLRAFYLTCNGWPADGWFNPAINRLEQIDWLESVNPTIYRLALETESTGWKGSPADDPDLLAHQFEQGTRVKRSLAITYDHDDQPTLLFDVHDNWSFGSWAHWNPAMAWSNGSFTDYMVDRLARLLDE